MRFLVSLLLMALLVACASQASSTSQVSVAPTALPAETTKPVTLRFLLADQGVYGDITGDTYLFKALGNKLGISFDIIQAPMNGIVDKVNLALASNDMPDIMQVANPDSPIPHDYGPRGLFVRLDEAMNQGKLPNYKRWLDKYTDATKSFWSPDGHLYVAGKVRNEVAPNPLMVMRKDLLDKAGYDTSKLLKGDYNLDDLYYANKAMSVQLGGKPVWGGAEGFHTFLFSYSAKFFGAADSPFYLLYDRQTKQFTYGPFSDNYKEMIAFFARMYKDGLLFPNYSTMSLDQWRAIMVGNCQAGTAVQVVAWTTTACGGQDLNPLPPKVGGKNPPVLTDPHARADAASWVVNAKSRPEAIDAALRLMDFVYSDEGALFLERGEKGVMWQDEPNDPMGWRPTGFQMCAFGQGTNLPSYSSFFLWSAGRFGRVLPDEESLNVICPQDQSALTNQALRLRVPNLLKPFKESGLMAEPPYLPALSKDEIEVTKNVGSPLMTYLEEQSQRFIEGKRPLNEWESFVAELNNIGADKLVKAYNDARARMK